jgi:general secretion pathway protein I
MPNAQSRTAPESGFGHWSFGFDSDFGFCHSDFRRTRRRGFTLIEVLATMLLIAIVLPAAMQGISLAARTASNARRRSEAAMLAHEKIDELIATVQWNGGILSGDFSAMGWPDYKWQASTNGWTQDTTGLNLQELDVQVTWTANGDPHSIQVSSLVYVRGQESAAAQL